MSITLKELANFMMDFVNKSFVPLLARGKRQHEKCLQDWKSVSELLHEIERMSYWNLQSCLKHVGGGSEGKEGREYKKSDNSRSGSSNYKTYDHYFQKKDNPIPTYNVEDPNNTLHSFNSNHKDHSDNKNHSFKYPSIDTHQKPSQPLNNHQSLPDPQGFDKLIQSFRKLCQNFENNHKKLLREDQNYKQNFKEEITHF